MHANRHDNRDSTRRPDVYSASEKVEMEAVKPEVNGD